MIPIASRRFACVAGAGVLCALLLGLALLTPRSIHGQASPSATSAPAASATTAAGASASASATTAPGALPATGPTIDNDTAVRAVLPPQFQDADRLPGKWARADMPGANGGYAVFIATIYPLPDDQGNPAWWLLTNYLQWDGSQWQIASPGYQGRKLIGDEVWLAQNLYDITAVASPPGQTWQVFTVGYSASGQVADGVSRDETLAEIYDLTLTPVWSRIVHQQDTDTSNPGYVKTHTEDVDWDYEALDNSGLYSLVATVTDTDQITLTGASSPNLPNPGTTTTTSKEIYKWTDGVYVLTRPTPAAAPAPPAATTAASATPTVTPAATSTSISTAPPASTVLPTVTSVPSPSPTPSAAPPATRPSGTPAG